MKTAIRLARLEIPNEPEFVSMARLVVSSLAADRYSMSDDRFDSLKLAVSEACVIAIGSGANPLQIECFEQPGNLEVCVGPVPPEPVDGHEPAGLALISTLVDRCERRIDNAGAESLCISLACEIDQDS